MKHFMDDIAIRVENLSKLYHIGPREPYKALRDTLTDALYALGRIRSGRPSGDNTIWALRDVSFEVKQGEVLGIIGRNGAGKSTLLKILSRITKPTEGRVEIHGRVGSLLEVGTGFHPELTGRENLYLNGAILGMKKVEIERKFDEMVAFAEVEKFIDTPVKHYSTGMYLRLAFSVAAHLEPQILLVDEILAVGDAAFQKKCLGKMDDVAKEGRTVVFVSHNVLSLQSLCTRGILLGSGQILKEGSITAVIEEYLGSGWDKSGEVAWPTPDSAPGDDRIRLKAVRVVSEGVATGDVDISKEFSIEIDYWNLEANSRRLVSVHLYNSKGVCVLTSGNLPSVSLKPDPWYSRRYPVGLFRTSCTIPGCFLNDGLHSIHVYINERGANDTILLVRDVLAFIVQDTGVMREEYKGPWLGAVRPRLHWQTTQLNAPDE